MWFWVLIALEAFFPHSWLFFHCFFLLFFFILLFFLKVLCTVTTPYCLYSFISIIRDLGAVWWKCPRNYIPPKIIDKTATRISPFNFCSDNKKWVYNVANSSVMSSISLHSDQVIVWGMLILSSLRACVLYLLVQMLSSILTPVFTKLFRIRIKIRLKLKILLLWTFFQATIIT